MALADNQRNAMGTVNCRAIRSLNKKDLAWLGAVGGEWSERFSAEIPGCGFVLVVS